MGATSALKMRRSEKLNTHGGGPETVSTAVVPSFSEAALSEQLPWTVTSWTPE